MNKNTNRIRSALVGVDLSQHAAQTLHCAALLSKVAGLEVKLHHVREFVGYGNEASISEEEREARDREEVLAWVRREGFDTKWDLTCSSGDAAADLTTQAKEHDLLILGVRGESHSRGGLGTVAGSCVRTFAGRVLLVNQSKRPFPLKKVVACLDFSDATRQVIDEAVSIAAMCGAEVEFVHVFRAPWLQLHYRAPAEASSPHLKQAYLATLRNRMEEALETAGHESDKIILHAASSNGLGIVDCAKKVQADLVVLGTHGRKSLKELFLGSTAERVLAEIRCSVMTVRTG